MTMHSTPSPPTVAELAAYLAEFDAAVAELDDWRAFAATEGFPGLAADIATEITGLRIWRDFVLEVGPQGIVSLARRLAGAEPAP